MNDITVDNTNEIKRVRKRSKYVRSVTTAVPPLRALNALHHIGGSSKTAFIVRSFARNGISFIVGNIPLIRLVIPEHTINVWLTYKDKQLPHTPIIMLMAAIVMDTAIAFVIFLLTIVPPHVGVIFGPILNILFIGIIILWTMFLPDTPNEAKK